MLLTKYIVEKLINCLHGYINICIKPPRNSDGSLNRIPLYGGEEMEVIGKSCIEMKINKQEL